MANLRAKLYRKHRHEQTLEIPGLGGGLNMMTPETLLKPNEFSDGKGTIIGLDGIMRTRPGLMRAGSLSTAVVYGCKEFSLGNEDLVAIAEGGYIRVGTAATWLGGSWSWTINNAGARVVMDCFYDGADPVFLYASGGYLQTVRASNVTSSSVTATPINGAGCPHEVISFVCAYSRIFAVGDNAYPTRLFIGAPGDASSTAFDSAGGNAEYIDLGSRCAAVCRMGKLIIVFTQNPRGMVRIDISDPNPSSWSVERKEIAADISAVNNRCILEVNSDLYFLDTDGLKSMKGVEQYGEVGITPMGAKIKSGISIDVDNAKMWHDPNKAALMIMPQKGRVYAYHYLYDAWTHPFEYQIGDRLRLIDASYIPSCDRMFYMVEDVPAAGGKGTLCYVSIDGFDLAADTYDGGSSNINSVFASKIFVPKADEAPSDGLTSWLAKELIMYLQVIRGGNIGVYLKVTGKSATKTINATWALTGQQLLANATEKLAVATGQLGLSSVTEYRNSAFKIPGSDFMLYITSSGGAVFSFIRAELRVARARRR